MCEISMTEVSVMVFQPRRSVFALLRRLLRAGCFRDLLQFGLEVGRFAQSISYNHLLGATMRPSRAIKKGSA